MYKAGQGRVMKKLIPGILALVIILSMPAAALAQEPAKYNFASAQGDKVLKVIPDGETQGVIYFYNIDGNRITHINLEVSQAPASWQVDIMPPLGETQVEINGEIVTVSENLYVEPSSVLNEAVEDPPEGAVFITVPDRGYALAKEAKIVIRVPATEEIGTADDITISATAQWLGQSGAVAIKQNRDFTFTVEVVDKTPDFEEKVLDNKSSGGIWLPAIIGVAVFVLLASIILLYIKRRHD